MRSVDHLIKKKPNFLPNILNPIYASRCFLTITQDFPALFAKVGSPTAFYRVID
jgi:hypothetical protein